MLRNNHCSNLLICQCGRLSETTVPFLYRVGGFIGHDLLEGITRSRRTIVLLSQHFLDSHWCEFEFEMSQQQLLEDPNFKMIVILMQRPKELKKIPKLAFLHHRHLGFLCFPNHRSNFFIFCEPAYVGILKKFIFFFTDLSEHT